MLNEKNIFQPESFGGEFSYHPFRDQFGRRCSIGKYNKTENKRRDQTQKESENKSELFSLKSQNLPIDSWNISISSVVKNSRGFADSNQFFDGVTKLRIENVQIGYTAHLYDSISD